MPSGATRIGVDLVVRPLPTSKDMSTEAEDVVGIRYQAVTNEEVAYWMLDVFSSEKCLDQWRHYDL
jgi:hypothetical protein